MVFGILVTSRPLSTMHTISKQRISGNDVSFDNVLRLNYIEVPYVRNDSKLPKIDSFNEYSKETWLKSWIEVVTKNQEDFIQGVLNVKTLDDSTYLLQETLVLSTNKHSKPIISHQILLVDGFEMETINPLTYAKSKNISAKTILNSIQQYLDQYQQTNSFISIPLVDESNLESFSFYPTQEILHIILNTSVILEDGSLMTTPQVHSIPLTQP